MKDENKFLENKTIILGAMGSIAAYKAADITSRLTEAGANVYVVMTREACEFIKPLTLQVLSRNPVSFDLWKENEGWQPEHIELADKADLLLIAPATAHGLALFSNGLAPDLLSTIYLATPAPVMIAPAMNGKMLAHTATQKNMEILLDRGCQFIDPDEGVLACGYEGKGKLAEVAKIITAVKLFFANQSKLNGH